MLTIVRTSGGLVEVELTALETGLLHHDRSLLLSGWRAGDCRMSLLRALEILAPDDAEWLGWGVVGSLKRNRGKDPEIHQIGMEMFHAVMRQVEPVIAEDGTVSMELAKPVVFWKWGDGRPDVIQRVLSMMGYLRHSRLEEWQRGAQ